MCTNSIQDELITRLHRSDCTAISDIYEVYSGALYNMVLRIVHSQELAQQVLQDTFVKTWSGRMQYDATKGRLFTWMLNIARNTAIDATRTVHYKHQQKTGELHELINTPGPETLNTDTIDLQKIVDKLDVKYRTLIHLVYFKGYTQLEAAHHTGIPLGTIKTRIRFAILELRYTFSIVNTPVSL